jgi:large subunit ribosomal protein L25
MDIASLGIEKRQKVGTRHCRQLRASGMVPGIVYGHGQEALSVSVSAHDLGVAIQHGHQLVKASLDGQEQSFLIKEVQYDHLGVDILHVDFTRVDLDERVQVTVPIVTHGTPIGVTEEQGTLMLNLAELTIECVATQIPDEISVMVRDLHINDQVRVADLDLPEGAVPDEDPETVVATVTFVTEEEVAPAEEEEEAAEPELIGAEEEQEEGAEGAEGGEQAEQEG